MANNFTTAYIGLGVDIKEFTKDIRNVSERTQTALNDMKLSADAFDSRWGDLTRGIKDTKRIVSGILVSQGFYALSNVLVGAGASALTFSRNMETAAISMEYFVKGADKVVKAQAFLKTMNEFAARTPFTTEQSLALSKYMQAVGVSMNTTKSFLKVITDTAAATGATEENLQRIVFGLGQMMTKGRLANEEIRQLANANIPIYEILQEELNLTGAQISKIGKSWVSSDKAVTAILTGLEKRYKGAADKISDTMTGMTDTILDNAKIIAQVAGENLFESTKSKMTGIRDMLDVYRQVVSEGVYVSETGKVVSKAFAEASIAQEKYYAGSAGLFEYVLKQLDATGELGDALMDVIGNTRQFSIALREAYTAAQPVVKVIGQGLYAATTVSLYALTSFSKVVAGTVTTLSHLGVASETVGRTVASLYITYKAASWLSFMGQGAIAAAYGLYKTAAAVGAMIPALAGASVAAKVLTGSIIGLSVYGLAAVGVFGAINDALSGVAKTMQNGGQLFDYTELQAYYDKLAEYQEAYEAPYTEIANGAGTAVDGFADVADASATAAKKVKRDWTASFDEVYSIPEQEAAALTDLGAMLKMPMLDFSALDAFADKLAVPKIDLDSIFGPSMFDSELVTTNFWYSLIPMFGFSVAWNIGKLWAKKRAEGGQNPDGTVGGPGGSGGGSGGGSSGGVGSLPKTIPEMQNALRATLKAFETQEKELNNLLLTIEQTNDPALLANLLDKLSRQTATGLSTQERINTLYITLGNTSKILNSAALRSAADVLDIANMRMQAAVALSNNTLAKGTDYIAQEAARTANAAIRKMEDIYRTFVERNGSASPALTEAAGGLINVGGVDQRSKELSEAVAGIQKLMRDNGNNAFALTQDIKEVNSALNKLVDELLRDRKDASNLLPLQRIMENITDVQKLQAEVQENLAKIEAYSLAKNTATTRNEITGGKASAAHFEKLLSNLVTANQELYFQIEQGLVLIGQDDPVETARIVAAAAVNASNRAISKVSEAFDSLHIQVAQIIEPVLAIEKYGLGLATIRSGMEEVSTSITHISEVMSTLTGKGVVGDTTGLQAVLLKLQDYYMYLSPAAKDKPPFSAAEIRTELVTALGDYGKSIGASAEHIAKVTQLFDRRLEVASGSVVGIDDYIQAQRLIADSAPKFKASADALRDFHQGLYRLNLALTEEISVFPLIDIATFNKRAAADVVELSKKFADLVGENKAKVDIIINEARSELARRSNLWGVAPKREPYDYDAAAAKLLEEKTRIPALTTPNVGEAYRIGQDGDVWQRWLDTPAHLSGIFDISLLAMSGTDYAGLYGRSGYGYTPQSMALGNITEEAKYKYGLRNQRPLTTASIMNMEFGVQTEGFIGALIEKFFKELSGNITKRIGTDGKEHFLTLEEMASKRTGLGLLNGDNLIAPNAEMQAQIDYVIAKYIRGVANPLGPLDTKFLSSFVTKLEPMLKEFSLTNKATADNAEAIKEIRNMLKVRKVDPRIGTSGSRLIPMENIYFIPAKSFNVMLTKSEDIFKQAVEQATLTGAKYAVLGVLDPLTVGMGPDYSQTAYLNPLRDHDRIQLIAKSQAIKQTLEELGKGGMRALENTHLIFIEVNDAMREAAKLAARTSIMYQQKLAANHMVYENIAQALRVQLVDQYPLGLPDSARYVTPELAPPSTGNGRFTEYLAQLYKMVQQGDPVIAANALTYLEDIREKLTSIDVVGKTQFTDGVVKLGTDLSGVQLAVEMAGPDRLRIYNAIGTLINHVDGVRDAVQISLSDMVTTINRALEYKTLTNQGPLLLTDAAYTAADGTETSVKELLYRIRAVEQQIVGNEATPLSKLISSFLDGGAVNQQIRNPAVPMNVWQATDALPSTFTGVPAITELLANTVEMLVTGANSIASLSEASKAIKSIDAASDAMKMLDFAAKDGFINLKTAEHVITFLSDFLTKGLTFATNADRILETTTGITALLDMVFEADPAKLTGVVDALTKWLPHSLTTSLTDFTIKFAQALNSNVLPILGTQFTVPQVVGSISGFGTDTFQIGLVRDLNNSTKLFLRTGENLFDATRVSVINIAEKVRATVESNAAKFGLNTDYATDLINKYVEQISRISAWSGFKGADDLAGSGLAGSGLAGDIGEAAENLDDAAKLLKDSVGWTVSASSKEIANFVGAVSKWGPIIGFVLGFAQELSEGNRIRIARDEMLANIDYSSETTGRGDINPDKYYVAKSALDALLSAVSPGEWLTTRSTEAQVMKDYWGMTPEEQVFWGGKGFTSTQDSVLAFLFGGERGDFGASYSERLIVDARETAAKLGMDFADYVKQQLNERTDLAKVIDYVIRSGDIQSNIAKAFYREFSDIFGTVIRPAFVNLVDNWEKQSIGLNIGSNDWTYKNLPGIVQEAVSNSVSNLSPEFYAQWNAGNVNQDGGGTTQISAEEMARAARASVGMDAEWIKNVTALLVAGGENVQRFLISAFGQRVESADDVTWEMKPVIDSLIAQVVTSIQTTYRPLIDAAMQNTSEGFGADPEYARVFFGDLTGLTENFSTQLSNTYGMAFTQLGEGLAKMTINIEAIKDDIVGFRFKMPETLSISQANLTTDELAILAQAGIQINSDGTVSVMTANNANTLGSNRTVDLKEGQVAKDTSSKLAEAGFGLDFASGGLNLDVETLAANMRSALFKLNKEFDMSIEEETLLAGLGNFDSAGMFEITNQEVLSGTQTVAGYFESLGTAAVANFGEVRGVLENIDAIIALGGEATRSTIAAMADGVTVFSPILATELTAGLDTAFTLAGASFEEHGEELVVVVNHLGDRLKGGVTTMAKEVYDKLTDPVKALLVAWGVGIKEEAGIVLLDTSNIIKAKQVQMLQVLLSDPSIYSSMPVALQEALKAIGIAMADGLVSINLAAHTGLINLNDSWYTSWNTLSEETLKDLSKVNMNVKDGLLSVEKLVTDSGIPEALDGQLIAKFEDLPKQLQDSLLTGDDSVDAAIRNGVYRVEQTTAESFMGVVNAVTLAFKEANDEAKAGVETLGASITSSLLLAQQLSEAAITGVGRSGGIGNSGFGIGSVRNKIDNVGYTRDGKLYYKERDIKGDVVAEWAIDSNTGQFTRYTKDKKSTVVAVQPATEALRDYPNRAARGAMIGKHAMYQAGEFGKKEAVIPLENKAVLAKVGSAVGTFVPGRLSAEQMSVIMSGVTVALLDQIYEVQKVIGVGPATLHADLVSIKEQLTTAFSTTQAHLDELFANLSLNLDELFANLSLNLSSYDTTYSDYTYSDTAEPEEPEEPEDRSQYLYTPSEHKATVSKTAAAIVEELVKELPFKPKSFNDKEVLTSAANYTSDATKLDPQAYADEMLRTLTVIENRRASGADTTLQYAWLQGLLNVNTNTTLTLVEHAKLEAVKDFYASSIDRAYDPAQYPNIKGSARGSLITKDALYRAGEFGLNEAIIPLERPGVMRQVGDAIYRNLPRDERLRQMIGVPNGGMANPASRTNVVQDMASQEMMVAAMTQRVLEAVLPAMAAQETEQITPIYVGTLIADEQGLTMLERKLYDVRVVEERRRR